MKADEDSPHSGSCWGRQVARRGPDLADQVVRPRSPRPADVPPGPLTSEIENCAVTPGVLQVHPKASGTGRNLELDGGVLVLGPVVRSPGTGPGEERPTSARASDACRS